MSKLTDCFINHVFLDIVCSFSETLKLKNYLPAFCCYGLVKSFGLLGNDNPVISTLFISDVACESYCCIKQLPLNWEWPCMY